MIIMVKLKNITKTRMKMNATRLIKKRKGFIKLKSFDEMTLRERKQRVSKEVKKIIFEYEPVTNNEEGD